MWPAIAIPRSKIAEFRNSYPASEEYLFKLALQFWAFFDVRWTPLILRFSENWQKRRLQLGRKTEQVSDITAKSFSCLITDSPVTGGQLDKDSKIK